MIIKNILALPRLVKRSIVFFLDIIICITSVYLAYYLRLDEWVSLLNQPPWNPVYASIGSVLLAIPIFTGLGFYRVIFRFSGWSALQSIAKGATIYGILYILVFTVVGVPGVPKTIGIIQPVILFLGVCITRGFASYWLGASYRRILNLDTSSRVLIYGAGSVGRQTAAALVGNQEMRAIGFVDDDPQLWGSTIDELKVYQPEKIKELIAKYSVTNVLLAIPSASQGRRNTILNNLQEIRVAVTTLPSFTDIAKGRIDLSQMRELSIDDLLGRKPVDGNNALLQKNIFDKVVMITGAGGTIGSELCRQIITFSPKLLLLVENSEFALYRLHQELEKINFSHLASKNVIPLLASVQDHSRMHSIFKTWRPDSIYHTAAYKHVPMVEHNPIEGIRNNVFGTKLVAELADQFKANHFTLVSTDKAVRPTNIMGASKRLAEMVVQAIASKQESTDTKFSMVRFGNVLNSSGSVVPKFRSQIKIGGPLTLTDPQVTRYFMTVKEAAQLVLQAGAMAEGGDVFLLDMGDPIKIIDLARRMIELSGFSVCDDKNPDGDIAIKIIGLRPGEKLFEELLIGVNPMTTSHPRIIKSNEEFLSYDLLLEKLNDLNNLLLSEDNQGLRLLLKELVSGYQPEKNIVDWLYLENMNKTHKH